MRNSCDDGSKSTSEPSFPNRHIGRKEYIRRKHTALLEWLARCLEEHPVARVGLIEISKN